MFSWILDRELTLFFGENTEIVSQNVVSLESFGICISKFVSNKFDLEMKSQLSNYSNSIEFL